MQLGLKRGPARAAVLVLLLLGLAPVAGPAQPLRAAPQSVNVGDSPFVRVQFQRARVTIHTWPRHEVRIEGADGAEMQHFPPDAVPRALSENLQIFATSVRGMRGSVTLPPESFSLASVPAQPHDGVDVRGDDAGDVTMWIPSSTALVVAHVGSGRLVLEGYRGGTLVARVHTGAVRLANDGGSAYAETGRGLLLVRDSSFERIRARSATGDVAFQRCAAQQIEVTTIDGNIVYDAGTFAPGLAHFESENGAIAVGVASPDVRVDAHSGDGNVFSDFNRRPQLATSGANTQATYGTPRTIVTAVSRNGHIFLYDGALRDHRRTGREWAGVRGILRSLYRRNLRKTAMSSLNVCCGSTASSR